MRIAIVCGQVEAGGVEKVNTTLATGFLKDGHDVTYVSIIDHKSDVDTSRYPFKLIFLEARSIKRSVFASIKVLRVLHPDIVLTSNLDETFFGILYKKLFNRNTRIVYVQHTVWSTVCALSRKGYFFNIIMPKLLGLFHKMDALVYVSNGVRDDMRKSVKGIRTVERTIYNPITSSDKYYRYKSLDKDHINIVTAGRLSSEKRQDIIIKATKILRDRNWNVETFIYGEGNLKDTLVNLCSELGIKDSVRLMGYSHDLQTDLAKYDIFVLSSIYESFGNVIVEAMNTGLPVVSTDCPVGPRELLADGKYGSLTPMNDPKAMADTIEKVLVNSNEKKVKAAFDRSMDFSVDNSVKGYVNLFEKILRK